MSEIDPPTKETRDESSSARMGEIIVLNVGGVKYETYRSTLTAYPDTFLGAMFQERNQEMVHPINGSNEYFIDRDGRVSITRQELEQELNFFQIPFPSPSSPPKNSKSKLSYGSKSISEQINQFVKTVKHIIELIEKESRQQFLLKRHLEIQIFLKFKSNRSEVDYYVALYNGNEFLLDNQNIRGLTMGYILLEEFGDDIGEHLKKFFPDLSWNITKETIVQILTPGVAWLTPGDEISTIISTIPITNPLSLINGSEKPRKAAQDLEIQALEVYEKFKSPQTRTFKRMSNFFGRKREKQIIEEILHGDPRWIVVSGARSTGKTALLREILTDDKYHVIQFDLRIPGFADLRSFTAELASRMETFFLQVSNYQPPQARDRYRVIEDQAIGIKRFRLEGPESFEKKNSLQQAQNSTPNNDVKFAATSTNRSDLAKLLEKFQEGLFLYHQVHDEAARNEKGHLREKRRQIPVIFIDDAHKLKILIHDGEALQILFDAMTVLTTKNKLCQIIHSTSNGLYERLLEQGRKGTPVN
ncbi:5920_t:CDS:2 [Acaulospora colombiana]|uniref:5920_t:CDS:1 n=1 Tax=Acaulospora colombiana TaxID=27376 RepID=A0ACA9KM75_9GLOM|nr:5920_t:CDS:2 [Acaulospora colombiana]